MLLFSTPGRKTGIRQLIGRVGPLGLIILLHIGFFYALQSGLLRQAAQATLPNTVFASFITPQQPPQPEPPKPTPDAPKTVPIVKKAVPRPAPPPVNTAPSEQAISVPAEPPQAAEPAPVAAAPSPPAPSAPSAPAAPAQPRTLTSGIEYIEPPHPEYPTIARRLGEEGLVTLRVLVNARGRPERIDLQKSSGSARLDDAARKAASRAVFKPHIENGQAVAVFAIVPIRFQLDS